MSDVEARRKEFEELAPWFAAGLLSPEETARMQAALAEDPVLRANVEAARNELDLTCYGNDNAGAPSPQTWARVAAAVAANPRRAGIYARLQAGCAALLARASGSPVGAMAIATAAALVIMVQGGAFLYTRIGGEQPRLHTASESGARERGPEFLVAFAPETAIGRVTEILSTRGAIIVDGPRVGGLYRVALGAGLETSADIEKALTALRAETGVRLVVPAPPR